jgi:hypothetical protein
MNILRLLGLVVFMAGLICMPLPTTNPEALANSVFPWLAMSGALVRYGALAMVVGAALIALSFVFRGRK